MSFFDTCFRRPLFSRLLVCALTVNFCLLFGGCATTTVTARGTTADTIREQRQQQAMALKTNWSRQDRLDDLSWHILKSGRELCGKDVRNTMGFRFSSIDVIQNDYKEAARLVYGLGDRPQVVSITSDSPADKAGLRVGDEFLSIDGTPVPTGRKSMNKLRKLISDSIESDMVKLEVARGGQSQTLHVAPESVCRYPVTLFADDRLNAFADGNNVFITQGMMRFTGRDSELQLVIAHEIAHNAEGHSAKSMGNRLLGGILDVAAAYYGVDTQGVFMEMAGQAFSQAFEREADYVAVYLLARAGIDTSESADFWRRMAIEYPAAIKGTFAGSHPATAERYGNIEATHREVMEKSLAGEPLLPVRR